MSSYTGTANRPDQAKAIAAVIVVHVALAFVILVGLNVQMIGHAVEQLRTFDVELPPPPPEPPPQPAPKHARQMKRQAGAPAKKAEPTAVVAPKPVIETPPVSPVAAAPVAGRGKASHSGASTAGSGTGAGGSGNGPGSGDYSKFTPAQRISKIPDSEYRRLAATGIRNGSVGITIKVNTDGRASNCRIARSSGDEYADTIMCELAQQYVRFHPALDAAGHPVAQDVTWYPNWWKP